MTNDRQIDIRPRIAVGDHVRVNHNPGTNLRPGVTGKVLRLFPNRDGTVDVWVQVGGNPTIGAWADISTLDRRDA